MKAGVTKNKKLLLELDKKLELVDKTVEQLFTAKDQKETNKKLSVIAKELESIYKSLFDVKTFTVDFFEFFINKNITNLLTSYLGLQNQGLTGLILPFLEKILFHGKKTYEKIGLSEEILLMNTSVINSLKILIHTINYSVRDKLEGDKGCFVNFLQCLITKFIIYPNVYNAISSSNCDNEENFDSALFELIVELFSKDYSQTKRENKMKIRKTLLLCLNLESFYKIDSTAIEKLLEYLVNNLIRYYEDYKLFDVSKIGNKEKLSIEEMIQLNRENLIQYLDYFSSVFYSLSHLELKKYLSNLIFDKLLLEYVQKDILNMSSINGSENKIIRILEFLYFFAQHVKNREVKEILFCFFFGFSDNNIYNSNCLLEEDSNEDVNTESKFNSNENSVIKEDLSISIQDIRINIDNIIKNNFSGTKNIYNLNIDYNSHKYESILAFFISLIESKNESVSEIKINLIKLLTSVVRNSSSHFLVDILNPYYLNGINGQSKSYEKTYSRIRSSRDRIDIIEILKNIHPKYFPLDLTNWFEYFEASLEKNYVRNINMLDTIDIMNNMSQERSESCSANTSNLFVDNNCFGFSQESVLNATNITSSNLKKNNWPYQGNCNSTFATHFTENDYNFLYLTSPTKYESSVAGSSKSLSQIHSGFISPVIPVINTRIQFYEVLTKYFKNFSNNKYTENLFLTELFLEIFSMPFLIQMGDQGDSLYNIYSNVTFTVQKKSSLYKLSSVGLINEIENKLDDQVRFNYKKDDIEKKIMSRIKSKYKSNPNSNYIRENISYFNANNGSNKKNKISEDDEFIDNLILFIEFFKEYLSNIFGKCYLDQINANYTRGFSHYELTK